MNYFPSFYFFIGFDPGKLHIYRIGPGSPAGGEVNTSHFVILERRWTGKQSSKFLESEFYLLHNVEKRTVFSSRKNNLFLKVIPLLHLNPPFLKNFMCLLCLSGGQTSFLLSLLFFIVHSLFLLLFSSLKFSKFSVVVREIGSNEVNLVNDSGISYIVIYISNRR